jgi:DNA-binding CsgD family transcriptional regulator
MTYDSAVWDFAEGDRVRFLAGNSLYASGERTGAVTAIGKTLIHVKSDQSGKTWHVAPHLIQRVQGLPALTADELRALHLLASGLTDEAAGSKTGVCARTVRRRLVSAEAKLGARSRPHAVALALSCGLIALDARTPGDAEEATNTDG